MSFTPILSSQQRINALARSLIERPAFDEVHVLLPDPEEAEAAFIRAASWLYCLYYEAGQVSLRFLRGLGESYRLVEHDWADKHMEAVRCLRTELHHNLGFEDSDQETRTAAESWKRASCGSAVPSGQEHWQQCYRKLTNEAERFLGAIEELVRRLEADGESAAGVLGEWRRRLDRAWPAAAFDPLIADAAFRLGRQALRVVSFRNRHIERWRRQLDLLEDGFEFDREATLLIEKTLLEDESSVLPVSARDIMDALGIEPGPKVGRLMEEARRFFQQHPCGAEAIIEHLKGLK